VSNSETELTDPTEQKPTQNVLDSLIKSGLHEMNRERSGLLLSGLSAGLDIGFGPLMMGVVLTLSAGSFGDLVTELLLATVYSIGFIFVILGRSTCPADRNLQTGPMLDVVHTPNWPRAIARPVRR